ncbi:hypothetical protein GUJ93_ZPchr0013g34186 [Zizania palustris]|uniref:Uncharacterized protein n=1 Tax=Zizania palustris TaxID=103762 RepID=A0A8J6C2G2_ZIZPA|nr:hypothetical protein GUJ93_ZPchr0013g34186 [Zizania palustris]
MGSGAPTPTEWLKKRQPSFPPPLDVASLCEAFGTMVDEPADNSLSIVAKDVTMEEGEANILDAAIGSSDLAMIDDIVAPSNASTGAPSATTDAFHQRSR